MKLEWDRIKGLDNLINDTWRIVQNALASATETLRK